MDALVSTDWLNERLGAERLVVLDATMHLSAAGRDAAAEFAEAHIPGARHLDLATLRDPNAPFANALPSREQFGDRLRALGIDGDERLILYDDSALRSAARGWFAFQQYGWRDVALLDGGLAKWRRENQPTETGPARIAPGGFEAPPPGDSVRSKEFVARLVETGTGQLVDARDAARFGGANDAVHGLSGGHIPGARNLFYGDLFNADSTWRKPADIRARFEAAGLDLERPVTAYCGSGTTASVLLFALHLLGVESGALYDGSWNEWGADPATPKAVGEPA